MTNRLTKRLALCTLPALLLASGCDFAPVDDRAAGVAAYNVGDYPTARVHLISAMKQDRQNPELQMLYAKTLLALGDGVGAESALGALDTDAKYGAEARALVPQALFLKGQYREVLERTEQIEGDFASQLSVARASALLALDRIDEAAKLVASARASDRKDLDLAELDANISLARGDTASAREISKTILETHGKKPQALLLAGRVARLDADEEAARKYFAAALKINPQNTVILNTMGDSFRQSGDAKAARDHYQQSLGIDPKNPVTLISLAELELMEGNIDRALELVQVDEAMIARLPDGQRLVGIIAERRGNHQMARGHLTRYLREFPNDPLANAALASSYRALGELDNARAAEAVVAGHQGKAGVLHDAIASADDAERKVIEQAITAMGAKRWKEADGLFSRLVRKQGYANAAVFNNAAMVKLQMGDRPAALPLARRAYELAPNDPFVQDTWGWTLFINGREPVTAATLINKAYNQMPESFEISWHFAQVLAKSGRSKEARQVMTKLKATLPRKDHALIDQLIGRL